ncbi:hypothetical protein LFT45_16570 [Arthrobacter sp. FW305-BF8]|uniref:hypothetical protein n=1 Tax=Arthrobacter sp. FW305-BF8 TaxID=2879617 RepID=UPI001F31FA41|nr:hypothetical protein [Arthrobacter sp. FW305-BF8]UKA53326.1 hypothetical protein LFT45_16570 [Arthrobacter sp. FW305-BF8]
MTRSIATAGSIALLAGLLMAPAAQALPMETGAVTEPATAPVDSAPADSVPEETVPTAEVTPAETVPAEVTPAEPVPTEVTPAAPENLSLPVIEGDAVVGGTLSSTGGQWSGDAGWIQYTWIIDGVPVQTAGHPVGEADVLHLVPSMAGKSVQLTVLASSEATAPGTEASAAAVTVRTAAFTGVAWSTLVTGRPAVGQDLSLSAPQWDNSATDGAVTYQWFRGTLAIESATSPRYTVTAADVGQKLWAKMTLSAPGFTSVELSSGQVTGVAATFTTAPVPTVSGTARVGQVQTANAGTWAPGGAVLSYQWYRGTAAITGAVARTYTTTAADYGKALKVRVRATKAGFVTMDKVSAPRTIAAGTIVATKSLSVVGTHRYGQTVKVSQGWPAGTTIRYQWYRNGVAVRGGTGYALYLNTSYIGARVNVKVTVSKPGYATRSVTTATRTVGKALITLRTAPRVTGGTSLGSTLTANVGTYSPAPSAYAYQWYRNGATISGARYRTYRLNAADNGKSLSVRVWVSRTYYETRAVGSAAVKLPVWAVTVLRGDGTYRVGTQIKPGLYKATGTGNGCYWERLSGFSGSFSQIKANYFGSARTYVQILPGDVGFRSSGCGAWTTVPSTGARATSITKDGIYRVGIDILPGDYDGYGSGSSCYMALLTGFGGTLDDIYDNYFGSASVIVTVPSWAKGFEVRGCGTLIRE